MNVYAQTTVTRTLLNDGRAVFVKGAPVRKASSRPWTFIGTASTFGAANALARAQAVRDRSESYMVSLPGDYAYDFTAVSVYQASDVRGPRRSSEELVGPEDPRGAGLRWFEYTAGGPFNGWAQISGP